MMELRIYVKPFSAEELGPFDDDVDLEATEAAFNRDYFDEIACRFSGQDVTLIEDKNERASIYCHGFVIPANPILEKVREFGEHLATKTDWIINKEVVS